jgi:(4-alkanoyl-5-oxo-2,5-dihydrofuran-3-yl)methyl phosphate reductase
MILVIGATGTVGSRVVHQLRDAGRDVRVLVRDASKLAKQGRGIEVVVGDLARPETLGPVFAGVARVFLISQGPAELEGNAIDAARAAGVAHVVKLASMGFGPNRDALQIGRWHRTAEARLRTSGLDWTILRAGGFSSNALGWAPSIKAQGAVFAATGEGKVTVIDPRDIAAVAVTALTQADHAGKLYELTGPQALSAAEQVAVIGTAIGRSLRFVDVGPDAARDGMLRAGIPEPIASGMVEVMAHIKAGEAEVFSPDLERLLDHKPRTFAAWAEEHAGVFRC